MIHSEGRRGCRVVKGVAKSAAGLIFAQPVSTDAAPDYADIILDPMDLGSVASKIQRGSLYTALGTLMQ